MGNLLNSTPLAKILVKSNCVSSCCIEESVSYTPCPKCKGRGSVRKLFEKSLENKNIVINEHSNLLSEKEIRILKDSI